MKYITLTKEKAMIRFRALAFEVPTNHILYITFALYCHPNIISG